MMLSPPQYFSAVLDGQATRLARLQQAQEGQEGMAERFNVLSQVLVTTSSKFNAGTLLHATGVRSHQGAQRGFLQSATLHEDSCKNHAPLRDASLYIMLGAICLLLHAA
jgi:hypothetical protein